METPGGRSILKELDPEKTRFQLDEFGDLQVEMPGEEGETEQHARVRTTRTFPLTSPEEFISFFDEEDNYIGTLRHFRLVDPATRALLLGELDRRYFMPRIRQIRNIRISAGITSWEVETDRGLRRFDVRDREDLRPLPPNRILVKDADGNRYEIPDWTQLDQRSRDFMVQLL
ncbi:MAG: DUF1854 domain-containing protein [Armatimonadetes bacterium]|nr:DUF1854 domain-containing protein [Armatimonadota bacterium]